MSQEGRHGEDAAQGLEARWRREDVAPGLTSKVPSIKGTFNYQKHHEGFVMRAYKDAGFGGSWYLGFESRNRLGMPNLEVAAAASLVGFPTTLLYTTPFRSPHNYAYEKQVKSQLRAT